MILTKMGLIFVICVTVLFAFPPASNEYESLWRGTVTKRDTRGRVQVMETNAKNGTCMAEITYDGIPRIHVVVITATRMKNLGYLQINHGTEDNLSDAELIRLFNDAISTNCLSLIVPGYVKA